MGLSKEEKKAKKEAAKLEKLRKEEEARRNLKRIELQRELAFHDRRREALDKSLREMMLKIKEPIFRQDIEIMWRVFERVYDKKDNVIVQIMKLMAIADDQFQRTVASFCDTIDTTINKFLSDLDALSKENDVKTAALLKRADDETNMIIRDHTAAETHLQLLLYHAHTTSDALAWTVRGENLVKEDEDRIKFSDDREQLRSFLENNYNATWDEYKSSLRAYILDTADNQKQVRKLRRKENVMADIIASQAKKIGSNDGLLKRLRTELAAYESGTKQAVFRDRRNRHRDACYRLKKNMMDGVETDGKQLAKLVKVSDETVEWLDAAFKKVQKILRLAALCRKFETRREKVLPYGSGAPHSPNQVKISATRRPQNEDSLVANAISTTTGLTRLWHKISKAELTKRALYREKALLEEENAFLISHLQEIRENDNKITPEATQCMCTRQKTSLLFLKQPVSIEATAEVSKVSLQLTGISSHHSHNIV